MKTQYDTAAILDGFMATGTKERGCEKRKWHRVVLAIANAAIGQLLL